MDRSSGEKKRENGGYQMSGENGDQHQDLLARQAVLAAAVISQAYTAGMSAMNTSTVR